MAIPLTQIKHGSSQDRDAIASYFESIAQGIRKGQVSFKYGEDEIELTPADRLDFEVEVKRGDSKSKIKFKLSWSEGPQGDGERLVVG